MTIRMKMTWTAYLHNFIEVGLEEAGLMTLYLSMLDRDVIEERIQLHGLIGSSTILILPKYQPLCN